MSRPPTACRNAACSNPASEGGYCDTCRTKEGPQPGILPESKFASNEQWKHLYGQSRWRHPVTGLRAATLRRDIMCVVCKRRPSTVADHIVDHRGNLVLFFSPSNVRGVCAPCHNEKTGGMHGVGDREPAKPGLVNGRVKEYAPRIAVVTPTTITGFSFLDAINQYRSNPVDVPEKAEVNWGHGEEDYEDVT